MTYSASIPHLFHHKETQSKKKMLGLFSPLLCVEKYGIRHSIVSESHGLLFVYPLVIFPPYS
jgi:hypothetical protein